MWTYFAALNEQAENRFELIIEQMKEVEGVTEDMKASNQMAWVGAMNSIRNRAEGIVKNELISIRGLPRHLTRQGAASLH